MFLPFGWNVVGATIGRKPESVNLSSLNVFELYFARTHTHTHLHLDVHKSVHQRRKQISIEGNLNVTLTTINNRHSKCVFLSFHIDTFRSWEFYEKGPRCFQAFFSFEGSFLTLLFWITFKLPETGTVHIQQVSKSKVITGWG